MHEIAKHGAEGITKFDGDDKDGPEAEDHENLYQLVVRLSYAMIGEASPEPAACETDWKIIFFLLES